MPLRILAVTGVAAALASCAWTRSDDFSVSGSTVQRETLAGAQTLVIRCYCPDRSSEEVDAETQLELRITANHSSVGYHGKQSKPSSLGKVRFMASRGNGLLVLESPEYTYIHHALIVTSLRVRVPRGVMVRFEPIAYQALEGRRVGSGGGDGGGD